MKVALIHLDLGIGGAERLVVNIAICLKRMGHEVRILTSHHDLNHCFEETKKGGKLN
jgi:alpha-1,3/alpha-1,6-mannosyltransferase